MPHTPGPWNYGKAISGKNRVYAGNYEIVRAMSTHGFRKVPQAEREANARLIAAAPNMFAALKKCAALFEKDHAIDHFDWGQSRLSAENIRELNELPGEIHRAIAKAESA